MYAPPKKRIRKSNNVSPDPFPNDNMSIEPPSDQMDTDPL